MWRPEDDLQEAISTCRLWRLNSGHQAWQEHFSLPNRHTVPLFFIDGISSAFCRPKESSSCMPVQLRGMSRDSYVLFSDGDAS